MTPAFPTHHYLDRICGMAQGAHMAEYADQNQHRALALILNGTAIPS